MKMALRKSPAGDPATASSAGASEQTDQPALEAQLPALRQRLLRHAKLAVHDQSQAEDLVQDTLVTVFERHESRRGEATLLTWSTAILKNKIADFYRSPGRRRMVQIDDGDDEASDAVDRLYDAQGAYVEPVPAWQQPENHMEQRQMMSVLEQCVACLPPKSGRVFMMREWLGFESAEICERLGVSAENCRMILHRARMSLRTCMQRDWIGRKASA
jgi:RNA polymerase sigma-70 factor, ECF subfamily